MNRSAEVSQHELGTSKLCALWINTIEMRPHTLVFFLWLLIAPFLLVLISLQLNHWEKKQFHTVLNNASTILDARHEQATQDFNIALSNLRGLPEFLAFNPDLTQLLQTPDKPINKETANHYLKNIAHYLGVDLAWLLDTNGVCLAASNFESNQSLVGISFSYRTYFQEAMQGHLGRQYAFGRVTNEPGLYFSMPIFHQGDIIGVVAIKIDMSNIARRVRLNESFLTDDQGVVILASDQSLVFKALPNAPIIASSESFQKDRYTRANFPLLSLEKADIETYPNILLWGDQKIPALIRDIERPLDGFTAHLVESMPQLSSIKVQGNFVFIIANLGAFAGLWAIIATLIFILRAKIYRKNIEQSHNELLRLNHLLKKQAETDFLTNIMNRRQFDYVLKQTIKQSNAEKNLSLALFDIDHFKQINDTFGHDIGDKVLQHLSKVIKSAIRQGDTFARLGGEEFSILMPNTTAAEAQVLMENLRAQVAKTPLTYAELSPIPTTISIGVTHFKSSDNASSLLQRADDAMYQAKAMGRNQVVLV